MARVDPTATAMPLTSAALAAAQYSKPNLPKNSSKDPLLNQGPPSTSMLSKKPLSNFFSRQNGDPGNSAKKAGEMLTQVGAAPAERPKDAGDVGGKPKARRKQTKAPSSDAMAAGALGAAAATSFTVPWRPLEDQVPPLSLSFYSCCKYGKAEGVRNKVQLW